MASTFVLCRHMQAIRGSTVMSNHMILLRSPLAMHACSIIIYDFLISDCKLIYSKPSLKIVRMFSDSDGTRAARSIFSMLTSIHSVQCYSRRVYYCTLSYGGSCKSKMSTRYLERVRYIFHQVINLRLCKSN